MMYSPRRIRVQSLKNQAVLADECVVAERFFERFRGLMGRRELRPGEAMWFPRCNSVHTWFMRIPIDVVFLRAVDGAQSGHGRYVVTSARARVRAWRALPLWDARAQDTLELPAGTLERWSIAAGDEVCIS
jgi:uncharacterized membrane protein (UPF0127 family)